MLFGAASGLSGLLRTQNRGPTPATAAPHVALCLQLGLPVLGLRGSLVNPCRRPTHIKSESKKKGPQRPLFKNFWNYFAFSERANDISVLRLAARPSGVSLVCVGTLKAFQSVLIRLEETPMPINFDFTASARRLL